MYWILHVLSNIYFFKSQNMNKETFETNRNLRAQAREALSKFVNGLSISDMDSVRTQASMLAILTGQSDEITRNAEVNYIYIYIVNRLIFEII